MTYPSCSCSLLAHQMRRSAEPRGVCAEVWIASMSTWKRDTRFFTVMSNGVVVVPCSMKPRTWKRSVSGRPWISWCTAPGKPWNVSELSAFVDGARRGYRNVAGYPARTGELSEEALHALTVLGYGGIELAVASFQPGRRHQCRAAVSRPRKVDRVLAGHRDQA